MKLASHSPRRRTAGIALVATISAAAGWSLGNVAHDGPPEAAARNGRLQSRHEAPARANVEGPGYSLENESWRADGAAPGEPSCEVAGDDPQATDPEVIATMLAHGTEAERYDALVGALEAAADLPPELLWQVYEYDASERVRLLAFETYVDAKAFAPEELRVALQAGIVDASRVIRAEAELRLGELDAYELARAYLGAMPSG